MKDFLKVLALFALFTLAMPLLGLLLFGEKSGSSADTSAPFVAQAAPELAPAVLQESAALWDESTESLLTVPMTEYLLGAAASEMPQSYNDEALKAQIVATHSYYRYCRENKSFDLSDGAVLSVNTARREGYISKTTRAEIWGQNSAANEERMEKLVAAVQNELVTYDGKTADCCYYAFSRGKTESAENLWGKAVPYLVSVDSPWDTSAENYEQTVTFTFQQLYDVLSVRFVGVELTGNPKDWLGETENDDAGYVAKIQVGGAWVSAADLREWLQLRSTCFTVSVQDKVFAFKTQGYGHAVGLSQYGANGMALEGSDYREILGHYYPGTAMGSAG